jgi:HTH-type transcriptional regulator / antitoxin HigA
MAIRPVRTEEDYKKALGEIDRLWGSPQDTPEGDELDIWLALVDVYEKKHYDFPLPDPVEAIEFHMERLGLTPADLQQYIGSRSRVWEVLNRKRPLSLRMIRSLEKGLEIPAAILVQEYELASQPAAVNEFSKQVAGIADVFEQVFESTKQVSELLSRVKAQAERAETVKTIYAEWHSLFPDVTATIEYEAAQDRAQGAPSEAWPTLKGAADAASQRWLLPWKATTTTTLGAAQDEPSGILVEGWPMLEGPREMKVVRNSGESEHD